MTFNSLNIFQIKLLIFSLQIHIILVYPPSHNHSRSRSSQKSSNSLWFLSGPYSPHPISQEVLSDSLPKYQYLPNPSISLHSRCLCTRLSHDYLSPGLGHSPPDRTPASPAMDYPVTFHSPAPAFDCPASNPEWFLLPLAWNPTFYSYCQALRPNTTFF